MLKLVILVFFLLSVLVLGKRFFTINKISCTSTLGDCPAEVVAELNRYQNTSSINLQLSKIEDKIKNSNPQYNQAKLTIDSPSSIKLWLDISKPIFQITNASHSASLLVAENFQIFAHRNAPIPDVPLFAIPNSSQYKIGDFLDNTDLGPVLNLIQKINQNHIRYSSISLIDLNSLIVHLDQIQLTLSTNQDPQTQINRYLIIRDQVDLEGYTYLDVRFQKPVLK